MTTSIRLLPMPLMNWENIVCRKIITDVCMLLLRKKENLFRIILMDSKTMDLDDMARRFADYRKYYPTDTEFRKEIIQAVGEAYYKAEKTEEAIAVYRNYLQEHYDLERSEEHTSELQSRQYIV